MKRDPSKWLVRDEMGRFERTHELWTPEDWDNGYVDNKGRFRVYRPDFPSAYGDGYALRAHVIWWLAHGERHPVNTELHHVDEVKTNDVLTNLVPLTYSQHRKVHQPLTIATTTCVQCGNPFNYPAWRDKDRVTRFCSRKCFYAHPQSEATIALRIQGRWRGHINKVPEPKNPKGAHLKGRPWPAARRAAHERKLCETS